MQRREVRNLRCRPLKSRQTGSSPSTRNILRKASPKWGFGDPPFRSDVTTCRCNEEMTYEAHEKQRHAATFFPGTRSCLSVSDYALFANVTRSNAALK